MEPRNPFVALFLLKARAAEGWLGAETWEAAARGDLEVLLPKPSSPEMDVTREQNGIWHWETGSFRSRS